MCLKPDEMKALTASVIPEDADNQALTWESSNEEVAEVTKNGKVITNASGDCTITCSATDGSGVKATCDVHVLAVGTYGTTNGHEWIDLGLPSGTKWATFNVGADSPEEYGNYYAWGETKSKEIYSWNTYKYCNNGNNSELTKYCVDSSYGYNGFTDNKTELETVDDAATVNWGSGWRMPSEEKIEELQDSSYTIMVSIKQNGVNGCLIISKSNGNSIFLPYAGATGRAGVISYAGEGGVYSSRTLMSSFDVAARQLVIVSSSLEYYHYVAVRAGLNDCCYRNWGKSVRAVRK